MIVAELVSLSRVLPTFHTSVEKATGKNPAAVLQKSKRPQSEDAYMLAFISVFRNGDPSDYKSLRGFLHIGMLCAGDMDYISAAIASPHGLRVQQGNIYTALFAGDMEQWAGALETASKSPEDAQRFWAAACYVQFAKHNLSELLNIEQPKKIDGYLTYERK